MNSKEGILFSRSHLTDSYGWSLKYLRKFLAQHRNFLICIFCVAYRAQLESTLDTSESAHARRAQAGTGTQDSRGCMKNSTYSQWTQARKGGVLQNILLTSRGWKQSSDTCKMRGSSGTSQKVKFRAGRDPESFFGQKQSKWQCNDQVYMQAGKLSKHVKCQKCKKINFQSQIHKMALLSLWAIGKCYEAHSTWKWKRESRAIKWANVKNSASAKKWRFCYSGQLAG